MDLLNIKGLRALYIHNFFRLVFRLSGFLLIENKQFRIQAIAAASVELSC